MQQADEQKSQHTMNYIYEYRIIYQSLGHL
jgi:hypothetical protein